MPHTHCPRCDATYYTDRMARLGRVCPRCLERGERITLVPIRARPPRVSGPRVFGSGGPAGGPRKDGAPKRRRDA